MSCPIAQKCGESPRTGGSGGLQNPFIYEITEIISPVNYFYTTKILYDKMTKLVITGQGNVFTGVCLFTAGGGGGCIPACVTGHMRL